ncbi:MAG: DUF3565 domain-containing protein [Acidobacteriota bacterium]|nr:DUF3565 domain-containing protein [Acidobacteriota bacterium]
MRRRIIGFELDDEGHWRAELECGHFQHTRHDPPLVTREWALTPEGRASRVGRELDCKLCDEEAGDDAAGRGGANV